MAFDVLEGYGDAALGQWEENRPVAFHLRRRLSAQEQLAIGDAIDMRESDEGINRLQAMKHVLPAQAIAIAEAELGIFHHA